METDLETEICVIGGGPAGSTIARQLACLGHAVCLVERSVFPRPHVGESLAPGIVPLLEVLHLREQIEQAGFLRPDRAIVRWSDDTDALKSQAGAPGFQVDRGIFDQLLMTAAQKAGVHVIQPALVHRPWNTAMGWRIPICFRNIQCHINARFLVDATGRRAVNHSKKRRYTPPTIAVYAYWRTPLLRGAETRVEAGRDAWFWGAPLPDGTFNATVFVDPDHLRHLTVAGLEAAYRALLAESTLLRGCLEGELVSGVFACDAAGYVDEEPITENSIKVGESSFSIDPLASQGVQAAMMSGYQGSIVIHTMVTYPERSAVAMTFYRNRQSETVMRHRVFSAQAYAERHTYSDRLFWQRRKAPMSAPIAPQSFAQLTPETRVVLSNAIRVVEIPCIQDDFITLAPALTHPILEYPVAHLDNFAVVPLITTLTKSKTVEEIMCKWFPQLTFQQSVRVIHWLWEHGVLVGSNGDDAEKNDQYDKIIESV